jgi:hypothetical protein
VCTDSAADSAASSLTHRDLPININETIETGLRPSQDSGDLGMKDNFTVGITVLSFPPCYRCAPVPNPRIYGIMRPGGGPMACLMHIRCYARGGCFIVGRYLSVAVLPLTLASHMHPFRHFGVFLQSPSQCGV